MAERQTEMVAWMNRLLDSNLLVGEIKRDRWMGCIDEWSG